MSAPLPRALVWQADGHLTEEALVALADGQDVVLPDAVSHAHECEGCARRMGDAAILSLDVGTSLSGAVAPALAQENASASQRALAPLPMWALVFGLGFVVVGAVPFLLGMGSWLPREALVLQRSVPVFAHGLLTLVAASGSSDALPRMLVSVVSMCVLLMSAFAVSRLAPREGVAQ